jgi:hypothetical protein
MGGQGRARKMCKKQNEKKGASGQQAGRPWNTGHVCPQSLQNAKKKKRRNKQHLLLCKSQGRAK